MSDTGWRAIAFIAMVVCFAWVIVEFMKLVAG